LKAKEPIMSDYELLNMLEVELFQFVFQTNFNGF